jgi:glyoxylase-like metal-dependent hydrolase (beta-lactamase superfamily II)/8-oxo-dGTP pyrophosphatase MutT (NUDIX family)
MEAMVPCSVFAVLTSGDLVYVVQRPDHLGIFPGYHAFPGGKMDACDRDGPALEAPLLRPHEPSRMRALCRELLEELGFDLEAATSDGRVRRVDEMGTAVGPAVLQRRFRTWFYRIELEGPAAFSPDPREIAIAGWVDRRELFERDRSGALLMSPPIRHVVEALAADRSFRHLGALGCDSVDGPPTCVEFLAGVWLLPVRSRTLPPASHTNAFVFGDTGAPRVLVDPSPVSDDELEALLRAVAPLAPDTVLITHHHPDHHDRAERVAEALGAPVLLSADTRSRLLTAPDGARWRDARLTVVHEGQVVTRWLGQPVSVQLVPGHDAGQIAVAPRSLAWFLVGDLVTAYGTVVVGAPEGDMATYMATLERVIALDPAVILPSHGMPMRSCFRLRQALEHRRAREAQVLALHRSGLDEPAIVRTLYPDLEAGLLRQAGKNVSAHLAKLRAEGRS